MADEMKMLLNIQKSSPPAASWMKRDQGFMALAT
jgi:hypothetical protein